MDVARDLQWGRWIHGYLGATTGTTSCPQMAECANIDTTNRNIIITSISFETYFKING